MRLGAIDIGTNSCRILVVDCSQGYFNELKKDLKITRLGEGVDSNKFLTRDAISRTLTAIIDFVQEMKALNVDVITVNGTSALRDVNNGEILVDKVREETGLQLNIISGAEEARLNYLGAGNEENNSIIIDIGGGSTEFIWKDKAGEIIYKSLDIGSVRMTERFIKEPEKEVSEKDLMGIEADLKTIMKGQIDSIPQNIDKAIGLGGTITTIAAIDQKMVKYDFTRIQGYILEKIQIEKILEKIYKMNLEERIKIKGLQAGRADIIVAGLKILDTIMDILGLEHITVSEHDLLYGAIKELANNLS